MGKTKQINRTTNRKGYQESYTYKMTAYDAIKEAILALKERTGSSPQAIKKWLAANGKPEIASHFFLKALKTGVEKGNLVKVKGSYKLSAAAKAPPKKTKEKSCKEKSRKEKNCSKEKNRTKE